MRPQNANQDNAYVIEMVEPVKKNVTSPAKSLSIKSPIKLKSSSEEFPPPTYEEWLQTTNGHLSTNM